MRQSSQRLCAFRNLGLAGLLQVRDDVVTILWLLESGKDHFVSLHELLWILEVVEDVVVVPQNAGLLVGARVRVSLHLSGLASVEAVEVGTLLVGTTLLDGVALRALGLEDLGSLLFAWFLGLGHCEKICVVC